MIDTANPEANAEATQVAAPEAKEASRAAVVADLNQQTARRQQMLLGGACAVALVGAVWLIFGPSKPKQAAGEEKQIQTAGMVDRTKAEKASRVQLGNQVADVRQGQQALEKSQFPRNEAEARMNALEAENEAMRRDGKATIDALAARNSELEARLSGQAAAPAPIPNPPPPAYGPQGGSYDARGRSAAAVPASVPGGASAATPQAEGAASGEVKLMSFTSDKGAAGGMRVSRPEAPPLVVEDSPDYLPPNSYARARVIVGVDASAGVTSQSDPLPVVLRITGPARSVLQNGKVLTTRIQGCVVNGAARGDLSSEKVYVKLARMTCDQPGGRVAVSEVKGFISFAGKSGVRGRVVSREGNLITQALLAGIVGGFGRGFSANANSVFSSARTNADGTRAKLSGSDILGGGLGQGAGDAADTVSKYLIERAEQYQPVVEMPTGIDVEIVFLDGVYVRNSQ